MPAPTGVGGAASESVEALALMFAAWDWKPAFDYAYSLAVPATPFPGITSIEIIAGANTWEQVEQLQSTPNTLMQEPIMGIEVMPFDVPHSFIGDVAGPGSSGPTSTRFGRRVTLHFLVAVWADEQLGGGDLVRAIGGQIEGCVLYNSNRLSAIRNLKTIGSQEGKERSEIYRYQTMIECNSLVSVDA